MKTEIDVPDVSAEWPAGLRDVSSGAPGFRIGLKNLPGDGKRNGPVLLVHGASASSRTFEIPDGGLARYLAGHGWDVWLLDWRSSGTLATVLIDDRDRPLPPDQFNLDGAQGDLVEALEHIARTTKNHQPIPVVGHCIGGSLVAQTVATSRSSPGPDRIGSIVLTTLGLFYNSGLDDWVKSNERFLEEIWWTLTDSGSHGDFYVSPWVANPSYAKRHPWPDPLEDAYQFWKETPLPHACGNEFCRRACFMFGMPYRPADMMATHDEAAPRGLWRQFGRMPLAIYMHCVQNLRRGWVAPFRADDLNVDYLEPAPFDGRRVTLVTGNENQVWHRDSIDRMYEWLRRELPLACRPLLSKHVLSHYGHQDLYWSTNAARDVYPIIEAGLAPAERQVPMASGVRVTV